MILAMTPAPRVLWSALFALSAASLAVAQPVPAVQTSPVADALRDAGEDVRVYDQHVVTLANPFLEGRLPGTRGMEIATQYCEFWLEAAGLEPAFGRADGSASWRQPFPLVGSRAVVAATLEFERPGAAPIPAEAGREFDVLGLGDSGEAAGEVVFVGYGIAEGPDGYAGWDAGADLRGKVLLAYRFEPMDAAGRSRWAEQGWSAHASLADKARALARLEPAALIFANPPGADDPRAQELLPAGGGGPKAIDVPVAMIGDTVLARLLESAGHDAGALRARADAGGVVEPLGVTARVTARLETRRVGGANVGGLLRGRGALQDEIVVMGAHLDHLGTGEFGSRADPGALHPGADDNASGSAAVLMLADKLVRAYAALPEGTPARSILFLLFSGEESGLHGSRWYVDHPIRPIERHALMVNFDMIGRIRNGRLSVSGTDTAAGMREWLAPLFAESPLEIVEPHNMSGASDHAAFYGKRVPVLFAIIADFHSDYHTPGDVSWKINRVGAVHTVHLFERVLLAAATRPDPFVFEGSDTRGHDHAGVHGDAPVTRGAIRVRFGVMPATYETDEPGIPVGTVSPGSPAEAAGVLDGDRLMTWNGEPITDIETWMQMLGSHSPGDKVKVGIDRAGERVELEVRLGSGGR